LLERIAIIHRIACIQIIMSSNTHRFTGRAEDYDRYRQRYPAEELLMHLRDWCGLTSQQSIADIGAGTGMLSEVFLANGNSVIAIEPNAEMRDVCARLQTEWPALTVVDATAETTTLDDHSIDIVAAGRAFHWFNRELAIPEFRRILKPTGWVVLTSVGRSHDANEQTRAFEQLLHDFGTDYKYIRSGYRVHDDMQEIFKGDLHQVSIEQRQVLDWTSHLRQALSLSIVPLPADPRYPAFEQALRKHFERYAVANEITVPTTCWITVGRFD
jgi:ubiquinone/menaquinone biosynthesis C-methylase UbiE